MWESNYLYFSAFAVLAAGFLLGRVWQKGAGKSAAIRLEEQNRALEQQLKQQQQTTENLKSEFTTEKKTLIEQREYAIQDNQELIARISIRDTEYSHLQERMSHQQEEVQNLRKQFSLEFENLAQRILEEKAQKFTDQNRVNLKTLLDPLHEKIQHFEKKVEDTHRESIGHHASLRQQIVGLQQLHLQMSEETLNLTRALKGDNKVQGNWGELILERVLEQSGLEKGREYAIQKSSITAEGQRFQPDVVVYLPDAKKMIIDSKVSLVAYERWVNESDTTLKQQFLKEHVYSIKKHIEQLADKRYQDLYPMDSPDFVLLFVPIETAFAQAINAEANLYLTAFEKNIVIVTPSTLLATLRTIDSMWSNKKQQENALEIARQAGLLYDKFEGLVVDLIRVGKKIDDSKNEYDSAMNKLGSGRGNLISAVEKIKKMGAKAKKSLPEDWIQRSENDLESLE